MLTIINEICVLLCFIISLTFSRQYTEEEGDFYSYLIIGIVSFTVSINFIILLYILIKNLFKAIIGFLSRRYGERFPFLKKVEDCFKDKPKIIE